MPSRVGVTSAQPASPVRRPGQAGRVGRWGVRVGLSDGYGRGPGRGRDSRRPTLLAWWDGAGVVAGLPFIGEPEDVAAVMLFLASAESRYVTGQVITVDGGLMSHSPIAETRRPASVR